MEKELSALFTHANGEQGLWSRLRAHRRALALVSVTALVLSGALLYWRVPLRVHAALYRFDGAATQALEPEAKLHPGDQLRLAYRGSHESYVYVFNEATETLGRINTLFPIEAEGLRNPLPAGREHILPDEDWVLNVDEAGGTERILMVVSKEPLNLASWLSRDQLRGIHARPLHGGNDISASQLDRIVEELGEPNWSLWWRVFKLECESPE